MRQILMGLLMATLSSLSIAASWEIKPFLELSGSYTDNLYLRSQEEAQSDFVTQINPGVSLRGEGPRLDLRFDYRLQNLFYASSEKLNSSNQQMLAAFASEPVKNLLYFDGDISYRQMVVDPEGDIGQGNISINSFRQDVATSRLTPYLKRRLGGWSTGEIRYSRQTVRYLGGDNIGYAGDSVSDIVTGGLVDAKTADRWGWRLGFYSRKVKYVTGSRPGETWQNVSSTLDYRVGRKLSLNGNIGYESNVYQRGAGIPSPSGMFWNVGFDWRPTPRTTFKLGRGERYYGPVWNLDLSHRGRRTLISASYVHDLNTQARILVGVPLYDPEGSPIIDPNTSEQAIGLLSANEVFIRQVGRLSLEYRTRKSSSRVGAYREFRGYQETNRQEDINGAFLAWRWSLTRHSSVNLDVRATYTDVKTATPYSDDLIASTASYKKELGRNTTAFLEFRKTQRARSNATNYTENLVTARFVLGL